MYHDLTGGRKKGVFVRTYFRFRFGKWEHVCAHYRSYPKG